MVKVLVAILLLGNILFYEAKNQELSVQGVEGVCVGGGGVWYFGFFLFPQQYNYIIACTCNVYVLHQHAPLLHATYISIHHPIVPIVYQLTTCTSFPIGLLNDVCVPDSAVPGSGVSINRSDLIILCTTDYVFNFPVMFNCLTFHFLPCSMQYINNQINNQISAIIIKKLFLWKLKYLQLLLQFLGTVVFSSGIIKFILAWFLP